MGNCIFVEFWIIPSFSFDFAFSVLVYQNIFCEMQARLIWKHSSLLNSSFLKVLKTPETLLCFLLEVCWSFFDGETIFLAQLQEGFGLCINFLVISFLLLSHWTWKCGFSFISQSFPSLFRSPSKWDCFDKVAKFKTCEKLFETAFRREMFYELKGFFSVTWGDFGILKGFWK